MELPEFKGKGKTPCSKGDPEIFFPDPADENARFKEQVAKDICATCPYVLECLSWALHHPDEQGIWGGANEKERRSTRRRMGLRVREPVE